MKGRGEETSSVHRNGDMKEARNALDGTAPLPFVGI